MEHFLQYTDSAAATSTNSHKMVTTAQLSKYEQGQYFNGNSLV